MESEKEFLAWMLIMVVLFAAFGGFMSNLTVGLIVAQLVFFGLIYVAAHIGWTNRLRKITLMSDKAERDRLHAEVQRLNKKNVELVQEVAQLKYRN